LLSDAEALLNKGRNKKGNKNLSENQTKIDNTGGLNRLSNTLVAQ